MTVLRLALVGHTNVGKTSLLRTLARRVDVGEIADAPATTRRAEALTVFAAPEAGRVELIDTPGLERAGELLDALTAAGAFGRDPGTRALTEALAAVRKTPDAAQDFEQELRVLDVAIAADALLVVLDVREPVLGKYRDELRLLAGCGRPVVLLLNFTAAPGAREADWRSALAALGQHLVIGFDAVVADAASEQALWTALGVVLPAQRPLLQRLADARSADRDWRRAAGARALAETLLALAAHALPVAAGDAAAEARAVAESWAFARERERAFVQAAVRLHGHDLGLLDWPEELAADGRWAADLYAAETLLRHGADGLGPIAGGAVAGAAIDAAVGGLSLGAGAALGAAGGALVALRTPLRLGWRRLAHREALVLIDDTVLRAVLHRNQTLLARLDARGHAAQQPLRPDAGRDVSAGPEAAERRRWPAIRRLLAAVRGRGVAAAEATPRVEALAAALLDR